MENDVTIKFTREDYEQFLKMQTVVVNQIYRDEEQSFYDVMCSDESDFTKTEEGKDALEAIIAFGESRG